MSPLPPRTSPLRGQLGLADIVAQAASGVGPIYSAIVFVPLVAIGASGFGAGANVPLCILVAAILLMAVTYVFADFARRVRTPGSLYDYLKLSLGYRTGATLGLLFYGCAIAAFVNGTLTFGGLASALSEQMTGYAIPWWAGALAGLALVALAISRGITLAVHLQLAISVISIVTVALFAVSVLFRAPHLSHTFHAGFTPSWNLRPLQGIMMGLSFAFFMYGGFEGAASLAEECKNPTRAIPRAMILTIWVNASFYLLTAVATLAGFGTDLTKLSSHEMPLLTLATGQDYGSRWIGSALFIMTLADVLAMIAAGSIAIARGLLCLARDGLLPARFTQTTATRGVPVLPNVTLIGGTALAILVVWALSGPETGATPPYMGCFVWIGTFASLNLLITWCATCFGGLLLAMQTPRFLPVLCAVTGVAATLGVIVVNVCLLENATRYVPVLIFALLLIGWGATRRARSRD